MYLIVIALVILLFVWIAGPTLFMTAGTVQNFGNYLQNLPWLAFWTETYQGTEWQRSWTVFYWAWTISWAPYVGIFIARISRGRTIRQFVFGALGAPLLFTVIWFSVFGLAAMDLELNGGVDLAAQCLPLRAQPIRLCAREHLAPLRGTASARGLIELSSQLFGVHAQPRGLAFGSGCAHASRLGVRNALLDGVVPQQSPSRGHSQSSKLSYECRQT